MLDCLIGYRSRGPGGFRRCTEPVATRPLAWKLTELSTPHSALLFYTQDGNKNVSEVVASDGDIAAHYEYAPFGAETAQRGASAAANPWRFSSEYAEENTATVYYNYRYYNSGGGRFFVRDFVLTNLLSYVLCANAPTDVTDILGLYGNPVTGPGGVVVGPSSPYDPGGPYYSTWQDQLDKDRALLIAQLQLLCPEPGVKCHCCTRLSCLSQAVLIADRVYYKVRNMSSNVIVGGLPGNICASFGSGYGCADWQKGIVDVITELMDGRRDACFKAYGVGMYYPIVGRKYPITAHNWVKVVGCKMMFSGVRKMLKGEGVELDPWQSGGDSLFPTGWVKHLMDCGAIRAEDRTYWPPSKNDKNED